MDRSLLQITNITARSFASGIAKDPVQKLFLDKIAEYKSKAKTAKHGLVDSDERTFTLLAEELNRVKNNYQIKDDEAKITSKFSDDNFKLDPIYLKESKQK